MVFPTNSKLETHTKYSVRASHPCFLTLTHSLSQSLHQSNLTRLEILKQQNEEKELLLLTQSSSAPTLLPPLPSEPQEASERCRILYSGTKFFWKEQLNVDIYIYSHLQLLSPILEIIAINEKTSLEFPRLYGEEKKILALVGEEKIQQAMKAFVLEASNQRFKEILPPENILYEEMKRRVLSTHLLSTLHLDDTHLRYSPREKKVWAEEQGGAASSTPTPTSSLSSSLLLTEHQPENVIPVYIPQRRHSTSTTAEFSTGMNDVNILQEDIRELTSQAEILGSLITIGVMLFQAEGGNRKQRYEAGKYSLNERRWKSAIHWIIKQRRVQKTKEYLQKIQFQW
jgi:hypothetical protein